MYEDDNYEDLYGGSIKSDFIRNIIYKDHFNPDLMKIKSNYINNNFKPKKPTVKLAKAPEIDDIVNEVQQTRKIKKATPIKPTVKLAKAPNIENIVNEVQQTRKIKKATNKTHYSESSILNNILTIRQMIEYMDIPIPGETEVKIRWTNTLINIIELYYNHVYVPLYINPGNQLWNMGCYDNLHYIIPQKMSMSVLNFFKAKLSHYIDKFCKHDSSFKKFGNQRNIPDHFKIGLTSIFEMAYEGQYTKRYKDEKYLKEEKNKISKQKLTNDEKRQMEYKLIHGTELIKDLFDSWMKPAKERQPAIDIAIDIIVNYGNYFVDNSLLPNRQDRINKMKEIIPEKLPTRIKTYLTENQNFTDNIRLLFNNGPEYIFEIHDWFL
jgi:hypothetical protein